MATIYEVVGWFSLSLGTSYRRFIHVTCPTCHQTNSIRSRSTDSNQI